LLLHFQQLNGPQDGSSAQVHQKLRTHPAFGRFATGTAGSKAITADMAEQLLTPRRIESAVRNARALVKHCPTGTCSPTRGHADDCDPLYRTHRPMSGACSRAWVSRPHYASGRHRWNSIDRN
jgi:hypothetical protein